MKSRSHHHRLPINNNHHHQPPDDWGDGSWTVDCLCGVNFDDGEEMVNCDECGVWVHTRCSHFLKGDTSFACHKCKKKKKIINNNNRISEETEVAQLLIDLPTKTLTMGNPPPHPHPPIPPSSYPPPPPLHSSSFRLWSEIPLEERVHVQGVPGGDPALFQGLSSSVFTSQLWKCSGYVPKKFNFQYRDFPCWDAKKHQSIPSIDDPVDRGADALFSLSKQIVSPSPVEMLVGLRGDARLSNKEDKKRETNNSNIGYLQPFSGKRNKDRIRSQDLSARKRARSASKELHGKKRVSSTAIGAQQVQSCKIRESKVVETDFQDSRNEHKTTLLDPDPSGCSDLKNNRTNDKSAAYVPCTEDYFTKVKPKESLADDVHKGEDLLKKAKPRDNVTSNTEDSTRNVKPKVSVEVNDSKKGRSKDKSFTKFHHADDFSKKLKPKDNLATKIYHAEDTSKESWRNSSLVEIVVKSENGHQAPTRTGSSSETVAVEVALLGPNGISTIKKHEDQNRSVDGLDDVVDETHDPGDFNGNSSTAALFSPKLKFPVGDLRNIATEVQDSRVLHDSNESTSPSFMRPDNQPKVNSFGPPSLIIDVKMDSTKSLDQNPKVSVSEHPFENLQVHETHTSKFPSDEDAVVESKALNHSEKNNIIEGTIPISGEPCQNKEVIGSAGTILVQESYSESKRLRNVEEPSKTGVINSKPPSPLTHRKMVLGFGKLSPSTVAISQSEVSGSSKPPGRPASPSTLRPIHFSKRVKVNADVKKDHTETSTIKDDCRYEEPRKAAREHIKPSAASASKSPHMSRISHASISKRTSSDSKDSVMYSSSRAPVAHNAIVSLGSIETASTLQPQSVSRVQNRTTGSGLPEKGERINQLGPNQSKVTLSSSMHPPAPVNSSSTLSDEELALLLHQELNSSPRVPRVPRVRHAGSIPQLASSSATSMLIKRTSSSGGKDLISVSRRKSKEEPPKDGSRNFREFNDETKKINKVLSSPDHQGQDQIITLEGFTKKEALGDPCEMGEYAESNVPLASITTEVTDHNLSSLRSSPRVTSDDDDEDGPGGIAGPATRTLPGLLDEIMSKGRRMTYEELCNAVLPHWNNLRKHNGERYAYSSHSQAVLDCLRNRNEWAQLVDRGPK
ncbi:Zinc finger protein, partial [Thalictrum thalictroides]